MRKLFFLFILSIATYTMQAQDFVREHDRKSDKVLLRGKITFADIANESTMKWLEQGAAQYEPKQEVIDQLQRMWKNYRFVVFIGTWCGDTKDLLPKFYKVLKAADIPLSAVEMYAIDRNKEALHLEEKFYNISRVPVFIVMHQYRELGRVVESVSSTIEEDLLAMIEKDYMIQEQKRAARQ